MIDKNALYSNLNDGILYERLHAFEKNLKKNLISIRKHGGLRKVLPMFDGKHIIIVGAGPSLEKNFKLIKKYQHRREFVVIAVDMALKPLVRNGIRPGFVFSCETNPVDFFSGVDTEKIHLLAFSCMSNVNLRKWKGEVSFYNWMIDRPEYDKLWEISGNDLGSVATGNIITTQAVSFALGCNINSLVLAGNDLGFGDRYYVKESIVFSNNLLKYSRFSTLESSEKNICRNGREYEVNRGGKVFFINNQFLAAKMWLEDLFCSRKFEVYDCSIPGCSEKYIKKIELKDFFSLLSVNRKKKRRKS